MTKQVKPGDRVTYVAFGGERRQVIITEVYEDIKNGRPGFDAELVTPDPDYPDGVWGYMDQIV